MRAGVIGVRHNHVGQVFEAIKRLDGAEYVGFAEDEPRVAATASRRWGGPVFEDYRAFLDAQRPDVVGVATVNAEKASVIADCLERGIHVLADKPLVTEMEGLDRVRAALGAGTARLSLLLTMRFDPGHVAVYELIRAGRLGDIVHVTALGPHRLRPAGRDPWMLDDDQNGGILADLGVHYFDLLRWYTGEEAAGLVAAHGTRRFTDLPNFVDHGHALVTFGSGAVGHVSVDWLTPEGSAVHGDYRTFVTGTRGYAELVSTGPGVLNVVTDDEPARAVPLPECPSCAGDFLSAVRDGRPPALSSEDVLASTALSLRARDAARDAARVRAREAGHGAGATLGR